MTFREKLQQELPTFVNEKWWGGCNGCPDTYGYEIESDCIALDDETDEDKKRHCTECWDREAPKEREETGQISEQQEGVQMSIFDYPEYLSGRERT